MFIMFPKSEQALACPIKGIGWKIIPNQIYSDNTHTVYIHVCTNSRHALKGKMIGTSNIFIK